MSLGINEFIEMLRVDFKRYCEQIGIPESQKLMLATGRDEFRDIMLQRYGEYNLNLTLKPKRIYYQHLGECYPELRIILVNAHVKRILDKVSGIMRDITYADHLDTLIHELVHYRFNLRNCITKKFNKLIIRILEGEKFEMMELEIPAQRVRTK